MATQLNSTKLRLLAGVLTAVALNLAILSGSASGKSIYNYVYSGQFTGGGGTNGAFTSAVDRVAVDQANQLLYVLDNRGTGTDTLSKYTASGAPSAFSGLAPGTNHIAVGELGNGNRLAIDNSGTATAGNIYVASQSQSKVLGFAPTGLPLPGFPINSGSQTCGVAVDLGGKVWTSRSGEPPVRPLVQYNADGTPTGKTVTLVGGESICPFEFDSLGNIYAGTFGTNQFVRKYSPLGRLLHNVTTISQQIQATAVDRTDNSVLTLRTLSTDIEHFDAGGTLLTKIGAAATAPPAPFAYAGVFQPRGVAVNELTHEVWITNHRNFGGGTPFHIDKFIRSAPIVVPTVTTLNPTTSDGTTTLRGVVDPDGIATIDCAIEWGTSEAYGGAADCEQGKVIAAGAGPTEVTVQVPNLTVGGVHFFKVRAKNSNNRVMISKRSFRVQEDPLLTAKGARTVSSDTAVLGANISPGGSTTKYFLEWGTDTSYGNRIPAVGSIGLQSPSAPAAVSHTIEGLTPGTVYHVRLVVTGDDIDGETVATIDTGDMTFTTFPTELGGDNCANVLARKQTGAGKVPRCRAYELVSAVDTNGYDVESNLIAGQSPMPGYPRAADKALYTVHNGALPGADNPPNRGGDPYVATRGENGWSTEYVGLQADGMPSLFPFSSTLAGADDGLSAFAFAGPGVCDPCFDDGSQNIPLRLPDGSLVKGMAGSENPAADPAGLIAKRFSADGSHFVFGSEVPFEPDGNTGSLSIYDRNLNTDTTQVVSTLPDGTTMPGAGVEQLDISSDGSRILIGRLVGTDPAGNKSYDLYMHVGTDPESVLIADTTNGVSYAGMNSDGTKVFLTTADPLADDADAGTDLFRADVTPTAATVSRVSTGIESTGNLNTCNPVANTDGNNWNAIGVASTDGCGVVAIAGGGGVAEGDGSVFFLSPEQLDGGANGTLNEPNLYLANPGSAPDYVTTLEPGNALIRHAVADSEKRDTADFQVTPDAEFSVFATNIPLTGTLNAGRVEIYRYAAAGGIACASCTPTNAFPSTDTSLTSNGLNLTDDGRVLFTSSEQLVLRDTNRLKDVYEWDGGDIGLVSTGLDTTDSGLLTASADGKDAFFFTRQTLAPQDLNGGAMKIYDAREDGGFLFNPPPPPCKASDECHGAGSQAPPAPPIGTFEGTGEPQPPISSTGPKRCRKGFVKKRGRCVRKKQAQGKTKGLRR